MEEAFWLILCLVAAGLGFFYGKHLESAKEGPKKYDSLGAEDLDNQKDLKLFKDEPNDLDYLREELRRERETKKKQVDEYEKEINYLKSLISKNQTSFEEKIVKFT